MQGNFVISQSVLGLTTNRKKSKGALCGPTWGWDLAVYGDDIQIIILTTWSITHKFSWVQVNLMVHSVWMGSKLGINDCLGRGFPILWSTWMDHIVGPLGVYTRRTNKNMSTAELSTNLKFDSRGGGYWNLGLGTVQCHFVQSSTICGSALWNGGSHSADIAHLSMVWFQSKNKSTFSCTILLRPTTGTHMDSCEYVMLCIQYSTVV